MGRFRPQLFIALAGLVALCGIAMFYSYDDLAKVIAGGIIALATQIVSKDKEGV